MTLQELHFVLFFWVFEQLLAVNWNRNEIFKKLERNNGSRIDVSQWKRTWNIFFLMQLLAVVRICFLFKWKPKWKFQKKIRKKHWQSDWCVSMEENLKIEKKKRPYKNCILFCGCLSNCGSVSAAVSFIAVFFSCHHHWSAIVAHKCDRHRACVCVSVCLLVCLRVCLCVCVCVCVFRPLFRPWRTLRMAPLTCAFLFCSVSCFQPFRSLSSALTRPIWWISPTR